MAIGPPWLIVSRFAKVYLEEIPSIWVMDSDICSKSSSIEQTWNHITRTQIRTEALYFNGRKLSQNGRLKDCATLQAFESVVWDGFRNIFSLLPMLKYSLTSYRIIRSEI